MMQRIPAMLLATMALLAALAVPALAVPPEGVTVQFEVGYDGIVQEGRINPVAVEIDNSSPSGLNLSGDLVLRYEGTEYTTRLELPSPSQKRFYLYFPCSRSYPQVSLMVRTSEWTDEMDLTPHFKTCKPSDTSIVVLTDQSGSLQSANQVQSARITRDEWMRADAALQSSTSYVSYFDIDEVDDNAKFFARADSIILSDIDYLQLDEGIARALMENVARGANLVFSLGSNASRVSASPVGQLCPIDYRDTVQVTDLGEFGRRYGISAAESSATLATGNLREGSEVLSYAGTFPAVVQRNWGAGSVYALAFSFTDRPFRQHPGLAGLFSDLTMNVGSSIDVSSWFVHPQEVFNLMRNLEEAKPMEPGFVALFIILYVVLIGPLNFLVLGRMKRSTLVWLTIPVIIVGFSWFGLETGRLTRGSDNVVASFQEMHVYPHASFLPYQDSMYVFTAEPVRYELEVEDPSAFLYTDYPVVSGNQFGQQLANRGGVNPFITRSLDNTVNPRLSVSQGKWSAKEYYYRGYRDLGTRISSSLRDTSTSAEEGFSPEGSFSIDLPWGLYGCRLVGPEGYQRDIGDIMATGEYEISELATQQGSWFGEENYIARYREELLTGLEYALADGLSYSNELLLVGFTEEAGRLAEFQREHIQHTLSMVVVHLPFERQLSRSGRLRLATARPLLTGGRNFSLHEDFGNRRFGQYMPELDERRYALAAGGYMEFRVDLHGSPSERSYGELEANIYEDNRDQMQITDVGQAVTVEGLSRNGSWVPLEIQAGTRSTRLPFDQLLQPDNTIHLRLLARQDVLARMPVVTIN